jgi:diguanylate cyclase (GGDEF)-like protein
LADGRRANDFCARYGGEEFAVVLVDTPKLTASQVAEKLRQRIADYAFAHGDGQPGGRLTVSVGVASYPEDAGDAEALVRSADEALYKAKSGGRNCVVLA